MQNVLGFVEIVLGIHLFSSDLKKYLLLFVYFLYYRQNHCKLSVILRKSRLLQWKVQKNGYWFWGTRSGVKRRWWRENRLIKSTLLIWTDSYQHCHIQCFCARFKTFLYFTTDQLFCKFFFFILVLYKFFAINLSSFLPWHPFLICCRSHLAYWYYSFFWTVVGVLTVDKL